MVGCFADMVLVCGFRNVVRKKTGLCGENFQQDCGGYMGRLRRLYANNNCQIAFSRPDPLYLCPLMIVGPLQRQRQ